MKKSWKVIIRCEDKLLEITVEAVFYSDAYHVAKSKYPDCEVKTISVMRDSNEEKS